jgi:hypothetical protein
MITSQRTSLLKSMIEVVKIPLDSYEDLLFVQERLSIYYSMLERSLRLSYGQHDIKWCQQFTEHQLSIIGNKPKTPLHKALYMTLMEVKHISIRPIVSSHLQRSTSRIVLQSCLAMDRYAALQKYQDIVTCSYLRSNARDRRPASAAKGARRRPCW